MQAVAGRCSRALEKVLYDVGQEEQAAELVARAVLHCQAHDGRLAESFALCRKVEDRLLADLRAGKIRLPKEQTLLSPIVHELAAE